MLYGLQCSKKGERQGEQKDFPQIAFKCVSFTLKCPCCTSCALTLVQLRVEHVFARLTCSLLTWELSLCVRA